MTFGKGQLRVDEDIARVAGSGPCCGLPATGRTRLGFYGSGQFGAPLFFQFCFRSGSGLPGFDHIDVL